MKKKCAIFLAATKDSPFSIANVIIGINKYSKHIYDDIYIYHDGFLERDINALKKLANTKFILYTIEDFYRNVGISDEIHSDSFKRYTHMTFARFEMFNLLNEYSHVIYFDFDMLIQDDISELLKYNLGMCKGAVSINYAVGQDLHDIDGTAINFSAGLIIASDKINFTNITKECYIATKKFFKTLVLQDQAVLNYVFAKLNIKPEIVPNTYYGNISQLKSINDKIIHAHGMNNRFWNNQAVKLSYPEWNENYKFWLSIGGSPYTGTVKFDDIFPKDRGHMMQYLEKIAIYSKIMSNIQYITKLPLYCNSNFMSDIYIFCHGIPQNKFKIKLKMIKINTIEVYFYFKDIHINTNAKEVLKDNEMNFIIYEISKNKVIDDLKCVFTDFTLRSSLLFNEIKLI